MPASPTCTADPAREFRERLLAPAAALPADPDRTDLACVLGLALAQRAGGGGRLPDLLGLARADLDALARRHFPGAALPDPEAERAAVPEDQAAVARLIRERGAPAGPQSLWLADIIARRAMEPRHLWEDLGLPERPALTALMRRHFPGLVARNDRNMRWKKFFYRELCADEGFLLCLSPTCEACPERPACFPPEGDQGGGQRVS